MGERKRCVDCDHRYAVGRSKRCNICRRRRNRRLARNRHLQKTYGITIQEYDDILQIQHGTCAICNGGTSGPYFDLDHNHKTGEPRGLLCKPCNKILRLIRDDANALRRAAGYLDHPPARRALGERDWGDYADSSDNS